MPVELLPAYLALGAVAGLLAGLLGIGGGLVIVPALILLFEAQQLPAEHIVHLALGTSLATIAVTALSSVRAHHRRRAVLWPVVRGMTAGLVIGTLGGAWLAAAIKPEWLRTGVGVFMVYVALQMLFEFRPAPGRHLPGPLGLGLAGTFIGAVSALVGIGGGTLTVPFLTWCNKDLRHAIATSAACGLPIALAGLVGYLLAGLGKPGLPPYSSGYIYWPAFVGVVAISVLCAPLGARLAHQLPVRLLKKLFAAILILVAWRLAGV